MMVTMMMMRTKTNGRSRVVLGLVLSSLGPGDVLASDLNQGGLASLRDINSIALITPARNIYLFLSSKVLPFPSNSFLSVPRGDGVTWRQAGCPASQGNPPPLGGGGLWAL
jgi:hypothetical protein